jgi:protein SCO1/2
MHRRSYLEMAGTVGLTLGLAGCTESAGSKDSKASVVLDEPDRAYESSDIAYPAWGQALPDVTLPAPIADQEVTLHEVDRPMLLTFFYSHCKTVCPRLISSLRNIQTDALNNDYADAVSFFPTTFDPARDTADRLRTYADTMNVAADNENWHFLRPASEDRAKSVITDEFGVAFERTEPENMDMYMFNHMGLVLLVNGDNLVERAYATDSPDEDKIIDDLEAVRTA